MKKNREQTNFHWSLWVCIFLRQNIILENRKSSDSWDKELIPAFKLVLDFKINSFLKTQCFNWSLSTQAVFHCYVFMVCYPADRRRHTIYLSTDAIAVWWGKTKCVLTLFLLAPLPSHIHPSHFSTSVSDILFRRVI